MEPAAARHPSFPVRLWNAWARFLCRPAEALLLLGAVALFLESTATINVSYTIRVSFVLLGLGCAAGFPWIFRGWARAPLALRVLAGALLLVELVALGFGDLATLPGSTRGGAYR